MHNPRVTNLQARLREVVGSAYTIVRQLEGGGMSAVFLAEEIALGRRVVFKVLPHELAGAEAIERFSREITLSAALQHPQIVPVLATGNVDGLPYYVMPFVDGESLRRRLARGPLSIREATSLLIDVTRALAFAHDRGVVHRDVKPDNILITSASAVVSDFGVAKALATGRARRPIQAGETSGPVTIEGTSLGTPAYMAPEQVAADPQADHRVDLYALGIVAYEMLTGVPPFTGPTRRVLAAHLTGSPVPISRRRGDVPAALEDIVMRCLEKEPGDRPATAQDLLRVFQDPAVLAGPPRSRANPSRRQPRPQSRLFAWWDIIAQDLRLALRGLRLRPGFAAVVAITFSLGIGANAAMFGILDRLLFRAPEHIVEPDRLVQFHTSRLGSENVQTSQPYRVYKDLLENVSDFEHVAVSTSTQGGQRAYYPLGRGNEATRVAGAEVTPSFFPTLGVRPHIGRFFQEDEAGERNPQKLAVIGHGFWLRHFGGRPAALGQTLELGADRFTVVGVAPAGFTGAELGDVDVWIPIAAADGLRFIKGPEWRTTRGSQWLNVYARLKPDAEPEHALAQATASFRAGEAIRIAESRGRIRTNPDSQVVLLGSVIPGKSLRTSGMSARSGEFRVSQLLAGVSFLVLLLACANVANLLLARALGRRREIAVRLALGISRRRLIGQLLLEGVVLSALGAVGALGIVQAGSGFIRRLLLADSAWSGSAVELRVLLFTAGVALATGLLASLFPALQASNPVLTSALKTGAREGGSTRSRTRSLLVGIQASLALVLLACAGLFVRSLQRVSALPFGVDIDRVVVADIKHASAGLSNAEAKDLYLRFAERAREVRGVTASAVSIAHSFGLGWGTRVYDAGRELVQPPLPQFSQYAITPDYFTVMGIRTIAGRPFTDLDREGGALVAIINETASRTYWPDGSAMGRCVQVGADTMPCTTIVGIVTNARRQQLLEGPIPQIYRPLRQLPARVTDGTVSSFGYTLLARAAANPTAVVEPLRAAIQSTAPTVPYAHVRTLAEQFGRHTRSWTLGATMFSVFGALALVLAVVGLYSVVAFTLAQRTREYGVRLALGARAADLVRLTMLRGMRPAVLGIAAGCAITLASAGLVGRLLFETSARDPIVLAAVTAVALCAVTLASLVPGLRAAKTDPIAALRLE